MELFNFFLHNIRHNNCKNNNGNLFFSYRTNILSTLLILLSITLIASYNLITGLSMAAAETSLGAATTGMVNASSNIENNTIPTAESVYSTQSMTLPASVS